MATLTVTHYPASSSDFLEFKLVASAFDIGGLPTWQVLVAMSISGSTDDVVVYRDGAFKGRFTALSTVTGVGTSLVPLSFRVKPSSGWSPGRTFTLLDRTVDTGVAVTGPTMPTSQTTYNPYRMFARNSAHARSDWYSTAQNLVANPTERAKVLLREAAIMVQDPSLPLGSEFTDMVAAGAMLQSLTPPMPWVPGLRTQPSSVTFAQLFTTTHWTNVASWLHSMASVRVPGDPRINLDCESYQTSGLGASTEPSINSITTHNALNGTSFSASQLRAAMQPFLDQLQIDQVNPIGMYPNVFGGGNDALLIPLYIVQFLGVDRCCLWWEKTFEISESYRKDFLAYQRGVVGQKAEQSEWDRTLREDYGVSGQIQHVPCSDEDEDRAWGKLWEPGQSPSEGAPASALGKVRWYFDTTRVSPKVYQPTWYYGLDISALNGVDSAFYMRPLQFSGLEAGIKLISVGCRATPITAEIWGGPANSESLSGSALVNKSIVGLQIPVAVGAGFTWCSVKYTNALPSVNTADWTSKLHDITVPSTITADTPIWSLGQNNNPVAMLWWIEATAEFRLYVKASGVQVYTLATGLAKDTAHRIVIGRSGLTWRYSINGGAAVDHTTATQAGVFPSPQYGMGCADQATMSNNSQVAGTGIIFTDQALHYITQTVAGVSVPGFRSAAEFAQLSYNGPYNSSDHKQAHHNYPFEWFT